MDYKYIEQLLERYWECETSVEEERILRSFFSQSDIPCHLQTYAPLFRYQETSANEGLSDEWKNRVAVLAEKESDNTLRVTAKRISLRRSLSPLFKAAAMIAMIVSVGVAVEHASTYNMPAAEIPRTPMVNTYVRTNQVQNIMEQAAQSIDAIRTAQADTIRQSLPLMISEED